MGLYSGGLIIGRIFASEIWGAYFREGLYFGGGGGGGRLIFGRTYILGGWGGGLIFGRAYIFGGGGGGGLIFGRAYILGELIMGILRVLDSKYTDLLISSQPLNQPRFYSFTK